VVGRRRWGSEVLELATGDARKSLGARVEVAGLKKTYYAANGGHVDALRGIDLTLKPGTMVGVMGPSGSGKSTLLHLLGAMDRADDGRIQVGDSIVTELSPKSQVDYRRRIGFVFQRFHLLPALTVIDNVVAPLLPYRVGFDKHGRARELLAAVGLEVRERSLPSELSGGEQQRVAIARALIVEPILVLADEPTGNLDSRTGAEIIDLLRSLRGRLGTTVVLATHDEMVASRCDRVVRLLDGSVVEDVDAARSSRPEVSLKRVKQIEP